MDGRSQARHAAVPAARIARWLRDEEALGSRPMPLSHRVHAVRFSAMRFALPN